MEMVKLMFLNNLPCICPLLVIVKKTIEICPFLNFPSPLRQSSQRRKDEKGPKHLLFSVKVIQKSDCLNSFPQTHLISQDRVSILVPVLNQPVETLKLEIFEHSVVFKDRSVALLILRWLHFLTIFEGRIKLVESSLHLLNIWVASCPPFVSKMTIVLRKEFLDSAVYFKLLPNLFIWNFVVNFELLDLLRVFKGRVHLPRWL